MANTGTPATSSALVARIEAGWRPFRDAVRAIGRARMQEATPVGWTYRDLIAHVAAWEQLAARRLERYRETGDHSPPAEVLDADAFNARVVEAHRLVGAEALLDELDTAHRALVSAVGALSDAHLATLVEAPTGPVSWVVAVVAGNSYDHYLEHRSELGS